MENTAMNVFSTPFTHATTIEYELQQPSKVQITIYNHLGEQVAGFACGRQGQGRHTFSWHPHNLSAGVYYCVLRTDKGTKTAKKLKFYFRFWRLDFIVSVFDQITLELTFTAIDSAAYVQPDSIKVMNRIKEGVS